MQYLVEFQKLHPVLGLSNSHLKSWERLMYGMSMFCSNEMIKKLKTLFFLDGMLAFECSLLMDT